MHAAIRQVLTSLAVAAVLAATGCATMGAPRVADAPAAAHQPAVKDWEGYWIEQWPDSDQADRFRISLSEDGVTIQVEPLTNADRQRLADLHWDGKVLQFTNYADDRPILYTLEIDDAGTELSGAVRAPDGEESPIHWIKEGAVRASGPATAAPAKLARVALDDWSGNWEESWPDRAERDVYRVRVAGGERLALEAMTNVERQDVTRLNWNGRRLAFLLRFNDDEIAYEVFQLNADTLVGLATLSDGTVHRVVWTRLGPAYDDGKPAAKHWAGSWKEFWPGRSDNDLYQIKSDDGKGFAVHAVTNSTRQTLAGLQLKDGKLTFELAFDQNVIVYQLELDDPNTIRGTARLPDGQTRAVAWVRIAK